MSDGMLIIPDQDTIEPWPGGGSFNLLPTGDYRLGVNEVSPNELSKDGKSKYCYVEFQVLEGQHEGDTFRIFYTVEQEDQEKHHKVMQKVSALARAAGVPGGGKATQLIGKELWAKVKLQPAGVSKTTGKQFKEKNEIDKYYPKGERPGPAPAATYSTRPAPVLALAAAPAAKRPWPSKS